MSLMQNIERFSQSPNSQINTPFCECLRADFAKTRYVLIELPVQHSVHLNVRSPREGDFYNILKLIYIIVNGRTRILSFASLDFGKAFL